MIERTKRKKLAAASLCISAAALALTVSHHGSDGWTWAGVAAGAIVGGLILVALRYL